MAALEPMTAWERLAGEYEALGLSPRGHPLALLRPYLGEGVVPSVMLERLQDGKEVEVAGLVVCRQRPGTADGIVFLVLEDEWGLVNVIVYPDLHERQRLVIRTEPYLVVRGRLQLRDSLVNIIAQSFRPLRARDADGEPTSVKAPEARNFQ